MIFPELYFPTVFSILRNTFKETVRKLEVFYTRDNDKEKQAIIIIVGYVDR